MKPTVPIACALGIAGGLLALSAAASATYVGTPAGTPTAVAIIPADPVEPAGANLLIFVTPTIVPDPAVIIEAAPARRTPIPTPVRPT